jgi:hypothetical protein
MARGPKYANRPKIHNRRVEIGQPALNNATGKYTTGQKYTTGRLAQYHCSATEGFGVGMAKDIVALLRLFEARAPDPETAARVIALATDPKQWPSAHRLFDEVRRRWLDTSDRLRQGQYSFEEICLKTLYNETAAEDPFDSDSAYYVVPCAIGRAWQLGMPVRKVLEIVAPLVAASEADPGAATNRRGM